MQRSIRLRFSYESAGPCVLAAARRAAAAFASLCRHRRHLAVRRIDDQRGARGLDHFLAVIEPPHRVDRLLFQRARVVGRTAVLTRERESLVLDDFLGRHELASREPRRPLERRGAAKVPDALEVGMAVRRARQCATFRLRRRARRGEGDREPQRSEQPRDSMHSRREVTPRKRAAQCVRPREST